MKTNKFILKIASIAILTTSLITVSLTSINAYSYYNSQYGTAYRTGGGVTRYYGTPTTTSDVTENNTSQTTNNTNTQTNTDNQYTRSTTNSTTNYTNSTPSSTYGSYTSTGGTVTRYYGTSTNDTSSNNNSNTSTDNSSNYSSSNNTSTIINNNTTNNGTSYNSTSSIEKMLSLINSERSKNGLKSLVLDSKLTSVAQLKADDMVKSNYFSHVSPNYGTIHSMISNTGINYNVAGENIAKAYSIESAHNNFMNSWSHRRAILAKPYTHVGIGITKNSSGMYVISVMFIQK